MLFNANNLLFLFTIGTVSILKIEASIKVAKCRPPDYPKNGGYGPKQQSYLAGDVIHYYCDVNYRDDGEYRRYCKDTGEWSGDTLLCDPSDFFQSAFQPNTEEPVEENKADLAIDWNRRTCSSTARNQTTNGIFSVVLTRPARLIRIAVLMAPGSGPYKLWAIDEENEFNPCGGLDTVTKGLFWREIICILPNKKIKEVAVRSLDRDFIARMFRAFQTDQDPEKFTNTIEICEIFVQVAYSPSCSDPHIRIENGSLEISRSKARLVCDEGFEPGAETEINCVRDDFWSKKLLYCTASRVEED